MTWRNRSRGGTTPCRCIRGTNRYILYSRVIGRCESGMQPFLKVVGGVWFNVRERLRHGIPYRCGRPLASAHKAFAGGFAMELQALHKDRSWIIKRVLVPDA
jgi:hypothetical protein